MVYSNVLYGLYVHYVPGFLPCALIVAFFLLVVWHLPISGLPELKKLDAPPPSQCCTSKSTPAAASWCVKKQPERTKTRVAKKKDQIRPPFLGSPSYYNPLLWPHQAGVDANTLCTVLATWKSEKLWPSIIMMYDSMLFLSLYLLAY